ncbi:contractile injection system protein, VgrG/Pvc8 family [Piscirickettsia litoralis]|uniref:Uncharacterized protein n=1 Tax=Piscirickettsia litoralis TaxID=1891921 RepID=A0ABX2ZXQ4_9GAMM|nr:contractile injection system protein, VgrG/Pvc8 family [Piscirickettsia litoralis]ODN41154.1 hypothetical protein BGC07_17930 [Piscirickettsia litoralis]
MTPTYSIVNYGPDGTINDRTEAFKGRLLSMTVNDYSGMSSDSVTFVLDDADGKLIAPDTKSSIRVNLGYEGSPLVTMGEFTVTQTTYSGWPRRLTVTATSMDMYVGLKEVMSRSFSNKTVKEIIEEIATSNVNTNEKMYEVTVGHDVADQVVKYIAQTNESSMNFLTRFARDRGCVFKCTHNRIVFVTAGTGKRASGVDLDPINIDVQTGNVLDYIVSYDRRLQYNTVRAHYHDFATGLAGKIDAGSGKKPIYVMPNYLANELEASVSAHAELHRLQRCKGQFSVNLVGNPFLMAQFPVNLTGVKKNIDEQWVVSQATHQYIEGRGYTTRIEGNIKLKL